jgi:hypothetical protein
MIEDRRRDTRLTWMTVGLGLTLLAAGCSQGAGSSQSTTASKSALAFASSPATAKASAGTPQVMGKGTFHAVDGTAMGEAQLRVLPNGSYEVALESFKIGSIAHTNLVLVSNADVTATADVDKSKLLDLGPLKATEGMQDFPIPAVMASGVMEGYHTAVIWDAEMTHAIAAAPLR